MKAILKTIDLKLDLDYDETFTSPKNSKIRHSLVKELQKSLAPNFCPSIDQLTKWLSCLHKSRRSQRKLKDSGKISGDRRRTHSNNRVHDVSDYTEFYHFIPNYVLNLVVFRKKFDE